jgi:hypothetical protein
MVFTPYLSSITPLHPQIAVWLNTGITFLPSRRKGGHLESMVIPHIAVDAA